MVFPLVAGVASTVFAVSNIFMASSVSEAKSVKAHAYALSQTTEDESNAEILSSESDPEEQISEE